MKLNILKIVLFLVFPFVLLSLIFILFIKSPTHTIFPSALYQGYAFADSAEGGKSAINSFSYDKNSLKISYTLRKGSQYPYAGVCIQPLSGYFDETFNNFDRIEIELEAKHSATIQLYFLLFQHGVTYESVPNSYRHVLHYLSLKKGRNTYKIRLNDFRPPDWWYPLVNKSEGELGEPMWDRVHNITISNSLVLPYNLKEEITVYNISLSPSYKSFYLISVIAILVYYISGYFYYVLRKRKPDSFKIIPYKELILPDTSDKTLVVVKNCISENFSDPELNLSYVALKSGKSGRHISEKIKEEYGLSFKQYINEIRMTEARRFLQETDLSVAEIASRVGFGTNTHFNRVFKEKYGCTPIEFRNSCKKNDLQNLHMHKM